jgi:hypothetical protein
VAQFGRGFGGSTRSFIVENIENSPEREKIVEIYSMNSIDYRLPITIYSNRKLGVLEATIKYLREVYGLSFSSISKEIARDPRTVWLSYRHATTKQQSAFQITHTRIYIPVRIFRNRNYPPLYALIQYLTSHGFTIGEIAKELHRDYQTIWTTIRRDSHV